LEERWCAAVENGPEEWDHISREQREMCARLSSASGAGGEGAMPGAGGAAWEEPSRGDSDGGAGERGATDPPPKGTGGESQTQPDAGEPPASEAGAANTPENDAKPSRIVTEGGCGCRTASDPTGQNGAFAITGLLGLAAGLGLRRRRDR
jgi:MYXO-CTERM domain-containing protein